MHETADPDPTPPPAAIGGGHLDDLGLVVDVVDASDGVVVTLQGELDLATSPDLQRELLALLERGVAGLTLDLAGLEFLDSSGLGALYRTRQIAVEQNIPFRLVAVPEHVVRVLEVTAMIPLFDLEARGA
jgi:anti-sigma B factor antagonist